MAAPDKGMCTRRRVLKTGAVATSFGLAGCTGGGVGGSGELQDEINIGVAEPRSGVYAHLGEDEINGMRLAKKDLEEELDITVNFKIVDTETDAAVALEKVKGMVNEENVDAIAGVISSSAAVKVAQWTSRNGIAFMNTGSHSDTITGEACAKYAWRVPQSNTAVAETAGKALAEHADSWYLVYADYTWGETAKDATMKVLKDNGSEVVGVESAPLGATDYARQINAAKNSGAEGIGIVVAGTPALAFVKQIVNKGVHKDMKLGGPLLGGDATWWPLGKDLVEEIGVWGTSWSPAYPEGENMKQFMEDVKSEYDTTAYSRHYYGYTGIDQLVRAMNRAGSVEGEAIREELAGHDYSDRGLLDGKEYWRECDNSNIKPTYAVKALPKDEMQDDPYKVWFEPVNKVAGDDVVRSCDETGCNF